MALTPEQIADMDSVVNGGSRLTSEQMADMDSIAGLGAPQAQPAQEQGIGSQIMNNLRATQAEAAASGQRLATGQQGLPESIAQGLSQGAGMVGDVASPVIGVGLNAAYDKFTTQGFKDRQKLGLQSIAGSDTGQSVARGVQNVQQGWNNYEQKDPAGAADLKALGTALTMGMGKLAPKLTNQALESTGSAFKSAGKGIINAPSAALDVITPNIPEGLADVASLAKKYEIPLSLPQVSESRAVKNIQKVSQELPFSGEAAFRDKQLTQWQKSLFKTVGVQADRFSPKVMDFAFKKVGGEFDNLTKGKKFNIRSDFTNNISKISDEASSLYGKEAAEVMQKEALKVMSDFSPDGDISGEALSFHRARINSLARRATNDANKGALQDLEGALVDGITSSDPKLKQALTTAKYHYKNLIVMEPLAQKAKKGFISPTLLNNRVARVYGRAHTTGKSGDIGDLARVGHELLGELGGSDTIQKGLYAGAAVGSGIANLPITGAALTGNRLMQSGVFRNQALINRAINKGKK